MSTDNHDDSSLSTEGSNVSEAGWLQDLTEMERTEEEEPPEDIFDGLAYILASNSNAPAEEEVPVPEEEPKFERKENFVPVVNEGGEKIHVVFDIETTDSNHVLG